MLSHSPECVQVGTAEVKAPVINRFTDGAKPFGGGAGHPYETVQTSEDGLEEIEVWACIPGCPVRMLDEQSGPSRSTKGKPRKGQKGAGWGREHTGAEYADSGGASRFFYVAKANRSEREAGLDVLPVQAFGQGNAVRRAIREGDDDYVPGKGGMNVIKHVRNNHPTVKPIALMRYLVRLVTPPGGLVLDPFVGSGTTGIACALESCRFIGFEQEPGYVAIARARIEHWAGTQTELPVET